MFRNTCLKAMLSALLLTVVIISAACSKHDSPGPLPGGNDVPDTSAESENVQPEDMGEYAFHASDYFTDLSEVIWAIQQRFGMDAMKDTKVFEIIESSTSLIFAMHESADNIYSLFIRTYELSDMFCGDMLSLEGDSTSVTDAPEYGDGAKKIELLMAGGFMESVMEYSPLLSPSLHYQREMNTDIPFTVVIDGDGRILELIGISAFGLPYDQYEFSYEGYRISGIDCSDPRQADAPDSLTELFRTYRDDDIMEYYYVHDYGDELILSLSYDSGRKKSLFSAIDNSGTEYMDYSDAVFDEYGKTISLEGGSFTFIYNDLGPVMTYDTSAYYSDRGYMDHADNGASYEYVYEGDSFLSIIRDADGEIVAETEYDLDGKPLRDSYRSDSTGQIITTEIDDPDEYGYWIFTD